MKKLARFVWPIILAVIGIVFEVVAVVTLIQSMSVTGTSIVVPGDTTFTITKPGDYTLWNRTRTVINGQFMTFPDHLPAGATIGVIMQPNGMQIPLRPGMGGSMESGDDRRIAIGDLTFATPGQYQIVVTGLSDKRAFYLDQSNILKAIVKFAVTSLIGALCFLLAFGSGLYAFIRLFGSKS